MSVVGEVTVDPDVILGHDEGPVLGPQELDGDEGRHWSAEHRHGGLSLLTPFMESYPMRDGASRVFPFTPMNLTVENHMRKTTTQTDNIDVIVNIANL